MNASPSAKTGGKRGSGDVIQDYVNYYAAQVLRLVQEERCPLLIGALGSGKSVVLERARARIEINAGARVTSIDIARGNADLTPAGLLFQIANTLQPGAFETAVLSAHDGVGTLRAWLRAWMRDHNKNVVLLLDHIERLTRSREIFTLLRALYQQTLTGRDTDESAPLFLFALASANGLRRQLFSPVSPISNILTEITMLDCDAAFRQEYWETQLRGLSGPERATLGDTLDELCGGDPYVMRRVGEQIRSSRERLSQNATNEEACASVAAVLERVRNNPISVAPLYDRYAEMLEVDFDALTLAMSLSSEKRVTVQEQPAREEGMTAALWSGLFGTRDGAWCFRSGLARSFFEHSFLMRPARIVGCYQRNQQYAGAIRFLDSERDREPARLAVLEDVLLAWLRDANTPSQAWQAVAMTLGLWFGSDARLYRYHPREQSAARVPDAYYHVAPGSLENLADDATQTLLRNAHTDAVLDLAASQLDAVRGPVQARVHDPAKPDLRRIFVIMRDGREYGAIAWSGAIYDVESENPRTLTFWQRCFNTCFREITRFERDVLSGIDIAGIQRIAQENQVPEDTDGVLRIILTAVTAQFGLRFHRAVLLQASGNDRLIGRVGIGQHDERKARERWSQSTSLTLSDIVKLSARHLSELPVAERTPLDLTTGAFVVDNWHDDAVLGRALSGDTPLRVPQESIFGSGALTALSELMHVTRSAAHVRAANPVLIVPVRNPATRELTAALIVDKPFTESDDITQEQLDSLPGYAAQIGLVLQNEESQRRRRLYDAFAEFGNERWSLQQTLDAIAERVLQHMGGRVKQLLMSIWETSYGNDPQRPDRRQSTLRVARSFADGELLREWHFNYFGKADISAGCVDAALFSASNQLYLPNLPLWHGEHGMTEPARLFDGVKSVFSCALSSEDSGIPRGVLSFQSDLPDAFSTADREFFLQIARRATNIVEKARSYEGLSRARRNTKQLNKAMTELIKQTTNSTLYACILNRVQDLFTADLRRLDSQRKVDSAVLLAMDGNEIIGKLEGKRSASLAEHLAESCGVLRRSAMRGKQVFVEHASAELVARSEYGDRESDLHKAIGAEASVWARIGIASDMLLVLAWKKPRRMNHTERSALPLLTAIAARTNGVIEQERILMRKELESSLSVDDYAMIEVEYTHQWNKRIRTMRRNAQYARELLQESNGALNAEQLGQLDGFLSKIERTGEESIDRMGAVEYLRRSEPVALSQWLEDYVTRWNILYSGDANITLGFETSLNPDARLITRPTILTWILHELLLNARDAESALPPDERNLRVEAGYDKIRRGYEISIVNNKMLPREELEAIRNRSPIARTNKSGRGIWIAVGQVQTLLGGMLSLPGPEDTQTRFTIFLPEEAKL